MHFTYFVKGRLASTAASPALSGYQNALGSPHLRVEWKGPGNCPALVPYIAPWRCGHTSIAPRQIMSTAT